MYVAENIYQVRLPLPFNLNHVQCYLLRDDDGWTVVDSGLNRPETHAGWQAAFDSLGIGPGDIRQIVLTHFHPDHYGAAGWLQEWANGVPVLLSARDAEQARMWWQHDEAQPEPALAFFLAHGAPAEVCPLMVDEIRRLRRFTAPHPRLTPLAVGTTLTMGGRAFQALHAPGHADGQLIFYAEADGLLLSGDQVLLKITPNIGLWPGSEPNPLGRFLASLHELRNCHVQQAFPGHGPVITNWRGRIAELLHHHDERLARAQAAAAGGATAFSVATEIFPIARLSLHEMRFALAESIAHLELLVARGSLRRERDGEVWVYVN